MNTEQLQEQWAVFWGCLGIGLFGLAIAWKNGFFKPLQPDNPSLTIRGKDVLRGFGYFLVVQLFFIPFAIVIWIFIHSQVIGQEPLSSGQIKNEVYPWMILGGFGAVMAAYFQINPSERPKLWQQTSGSWFRQMGMGILTWFFAFPLVSAIHQLIVLLLWYLLGSPFIEQTAIESLRMMQGTPFIFYLMGVMIFTIVPLSEEILFRGLLQQWLKQKFGYPWPAILLSSLVFALFHFSQKQGIGNIGLLCSLFSLSCLLGYLYERQQSLWPSVALHGFFNFISFLLLIFK